MEHRVPFPEVLRVAKSNSAGEGHFLETFSVAIATGSPLALSSLVFLPLT